MSPKLVACCAFVLGSLSVFGANTCTLKSSVSGVDFDWSDGANYVEEPEGGPQAGDTIVIPTGVTALMSADASGDKFLGKMDVKIESGAVLKTYHDGRTSGSRYQSYVRTLTGEGTITTPDTQPSGVYGDLVINTTCVFDGQFVGPLHYRMVNGVKFTISQPQPDMGGSSLFRDTSELWLGCVGSIGANSGGLNLGTDSTLGYIGAPGLSESLSKPSYSGTYFRMDSGAYGGLTFDMTMNDVAYPRYVVLKGSNTTESIFGFQVTSLTAGPVYMRKEGTGAWRLKNVSPAKGSRQYDGVTDVQGGVLDYTGELSPIGENSALGTATRLYRWGAASSMPEKDLIPYAILLGGDETNPGFLRSHSVSEGIHTNYDRLIGLTGFGGFLSSKSRHNYNGISAASAGEKTLVLDGEIDVNDTVSGVTDGEGVVSIEKRGAGTWTVRPPFDITGKVTVKAGRLNLGAGPVSENYTWYRLRMKTNAFQDPLLADQAKEYYETLGKTTLPDGTKRRIAVAEFMFFDADGNRQCLYPMRHAKKNVDYVNGSLVTDDHTITFQATNRYALACQPGQFTAENPTADWASFASSARAVCALFEGGKDDSDEAYAAGTFHYNDWFDLTLKHDLDINDESTWFSVILRPANNTPPLVACDFVNQDGDASQWVGRNMTAFDVSASTDGMTWDSLLDVRLTALGHNSSKSGAGAATRSLDPDKLAKCYQFSQTAPTQPTGSALDLSATVVVDPGATLYCTVPVNISKLAIGADGMGAISGGAALAATGAVEVEPLPDGMLSKTYTTSLKDVAGAANLSDWTVVADGKEDIYDHTYDAETGSITISRKPLKVLFK